MFGYVVGIAVDDTSGLPAQEAALGIGAKPIDAVEVNAPLRAGGHLFFAHRMQWHTSRGIPGMVLFVDSALPQPAGIPVGVITVAIPVNGQIHPIASGRDLELAIHFYIGPVVAKKKLDDVAVPEFQVVFAVVGGQPKIQFIIRADKQKIQVGVGPECAYLGSELGIIDLVGAVLF